MTSHSLTETLRRQAPDWAKNVTRPIRQQATRVRVRLRMLGRRKRLVPSFLIVGAMKAGTTSLFRYLAAHPGVAPPLIKEVHYFNFNWARPPLWYFAHFPLVRDHPPGTITGEASPGYLMHPTAAARAHRLIPDARVIALVRDPVDRALSHYFHERRVGREKRSLADALTSPQARTVHCLSAKEEQRYHDALSGRFWLSQKDRNMLARCPMYLAYISHSLYATQIQRWIDAFGRDRVLAIRSEDLFGQPQSVLSRTLEFLEIEDFALPTFPVHNIGVYPEEVPKDLIDELQRVFLPERRRLAQLLQTDPDPSAGA